MDLNRFNFLRKPEQVKSRIRPEVLEFWSDADLEEHLSEITQAKADIGELETKLPLLQQQLRSHFDQKANESLARGKKTLAGLKANFPDIDDQIAVFEAENSKRKNKGNEK